MLITTPVLEIVVYKLPETASKSNSNVGVRYEYYVFAVGLGYLTPIMKVDWATNISNGAMAFDDPWDLCRYVEKYGWKITAGPSEIMQEWVKIKHKGS